MMKRLGLLALAAVTISMFQNCGAPVQFDEAKLGSLGVCAGISCDLTPLTRRPAVTTILLALGDQADDQLVINGGSSQLVAETVIRYTSPKSNPKILLVRDFSSGAEDPEDTVYVADVLLSRYDVTVVSEPTTGMTDEDLKDFDIVWLNNPGKPMGSLATKEALLRFAGGVILQGDDMAVGSGFSVEDLTGLKYVDNGTQVVCGGHAYNIDNNGAYKYQVSLNPQKIPGLDSSTIEFEYGNDIDTTTVLRPDLEVLATARGASCSEERPTIVRYLKN